MILHSHLVASENDALASTGILKVSPGSTNTIPGCTQFSLDIRSPEDDVVDRIEERLKEAFAKIARNQPVNDLNRQGTTGKSCTVEWTLEHVFPELASVS